MKNYEILYIIKNDIADDQKDAIIEKYNALVTSNGGTVEKIDKWGTKKFAYPINYITEGYYVLMAFTADTSIPAEIERQMRISDDIIRNMITCD